MVRVCGVGTTCGTNQEIRTELDYWGDTALLSLMRQVDPATGAALATTYAYDSAGRRTRVTWPDGAETMHIDVESDQVKRVRYGE